MTDQPPSDRQPPTDDTVGSAPIRQLLHAATGDRDAEARSLADRADDDVDEDAARDAVARAHGDRPGGAEPAGDVAEPGDVEGTDTRVSTAAGTDTLRYVTDDTPGFRRRKAGKGFVYLDRGGKRISSRPQIARIDALAIPPAWTDVWICPDAHGHLQATGRDAKGRKQYRYHPAWRAQQEQDKYQRMIEFGMALPGIRTQVAADYKLTGVPREKVVAVVVHLLESSLIRIGNDEYAKANGSFGLTTLRDRHVSSTPATCASRSPASRARTTRSRSTTRVPPAWCAGVVICRASACSSTSTPTAPGARSTRRTSTSTCTPLVAPTSPPRTSAPGSAPCSPRWPSTRSTSRTSDAQARRNATLAITAVSKRLGNTPTVARNSYVHPDIVDLYLAGDLSEIWHRRPARDSRYFLAEEKRLLDVLKTASRRQRRRQSTAATVAEGRLTRRSRPGPRSPAPAPPPRGPA